MAYTTQETSSLYRQQDRTVGTLRELMQQCVQLSHEAQHERVQEHLRHGAARRLNVLAQCVSNIYRLFPPNLERPLGQEALSDVQINLHTYVVNLWGLFDNWAWIFLYHHGLDGQFRDPRQVGLFKPRIRALLPPPLRGYLESEHFIEWRERYLTNYRDALVHRIPLYIPPAVWTSAENQKYSALGDQISAAIRDQQWDRVDALRAEQDHLGAPCFGFLHSFRRNEPPTLIRLHTQLISDGGAVAEFGALFLRHWRERA